MEYIISALQKADIFTKVLAGPDMQRAAKMANVRAIEGVDPVSKASKTDAMKREEDTWEKFGVDELGCPQREQVSSSELLMRLRAEAKHKKETDRQQDEGGAAIQATVVDTLESSAASTEGIASICNPQLAAIARWAKAKKLTKATS